MKEALKKIAKKHGIGFRDNGDKVTFYIRFNPDFIWHEASTMWWWVQNPDGTFNWWKDYIFDGKHRIVGPGYPAYAVFEQNPVTKMELLKKIEDEVKGLTDYKQYKYSL